MTGLVGHWKLDGNATDYSGKGHDGTNHGATATTDRFGKANGAMSFDGRSQYVKTSAIPTYAAYTMSFWAKRSGDGTNAPRAIMVSQFATYIDTCYLSKTLFSIGTSLAGQLLKTGGQCVGTGLWTHYAGTYDGTNAYLYVNGVQVGTWNVTGDGAVLGATLQIADFNAAGFFFNGSIDDVRIYNRALTAADVTALYHNGGPTVLRNIHVGHAVIR